MKNTSHPVEKKTEVVNENSPKIDWSNLGLPPTNIKPYEREENGSKINWRYLSEDYVPDNDCSNMVLK
jgi:hypothetical protein